MDRYTPYMPTTPPDYLARLRRIRDPIARERAARQAALDLRHASFGATQVRREALAELHAQGRTWEEVGELVGLSRSRVVELRAGPRRRPMAPRRVG